MTTDIKVTSVADIFVENPIIHIPREWFVDGVRLAAIEWVVLEYAHREALEKILRYVYHLIVTKLIGYEMWCLMGDAAWLEDTRITRYRKLWSSLKARGIDILSRGPTYEVLFEAAGQIKFFGAKQFPADGIASVVHAILANDCTYIAALPAAANLQNVIDQGWQTPWHYHDCVHMLLAVSSQKGVLIQRVGYFDDAERGFVALGAPDIIQTLAKSGSEWNGIKLRNNPYVIDN